VSEPCLVLFVLPFKAINKCQQTNQEVKTFPLKEQRLPSFPRLQSHLHVRAVPRGDEHAVGPHAEGQQEELAESLQGTRPREHRTGGRDEDAMRPR